MVEDTLDSYISSVPGNLVSNLSSASSQAHMLLPMASVEPLEFTEEAQSFSSPLRPPKGYKRKGMKVTFKVVFRLTAVPQSGCRAPRLSNSVERAGAWI